MISFDLVSTATWPSVSRASQAQVALTRCSGFLPAAVSNEPRSVLPSMATTSPATAACRAASSHNCWMQAINWAGSRRAKTRPKVSCEGIPLGKSRNVRKKSSLALLKRSMLGPAVGGAAQGGADGKDDDVQQGVPLGTLQPGIGKACKERCKKFRNVLGRHPSPPGSMFQIRSIVRSTLDEVNRSPE